jgi:hypothetical protein
MLSNQALLSYRVVRRYYLLNPTEARSSGKTDVDIIFGILAKPSKIYEEKKTSRTLSQGSAMSAPQIPNLNTLRRGGGGLRGRLRGRGRGGSSSGGAGDDDSTSQEDNNNDAKKAAEKDQIVQNTDNDASVSRLSAVDLGYLNDPFARSLTPSGGGPGSRRFPIINRGIAYKNTTS